MIFYFLLFFVVISMQSTVTVTLRECYKMLERSSLVSTSNSVSRIFFFLRSDIEDFPETHRVKVVQLDGMMMVDSTGYRGLQPR